MSGPTLLGFPVKYVPMFTQADGKPVEDFKIVFGELTREVAAGVVARLYHSQRETMVKQIRTRNSVYQIDETRKLIRRVSGLNPPITGMEDGVWREYTTMVYPPAVGAWFGVAWEAGAQEGCYSSSIMSIEDVAVPVVGV